MAPEAAPQVQLDPTSPVFVKPGGHCVFEQSKLSPPSGSTEQQTSSWLMQIRSQITAFTE